MGKEKGAVVAFALVIITVLTTVIIGISTLTVSEMGAVRSKANETKAIYTAEAGIEKIIYSLNQNNLQTLVSKSKWTKVKETSQGIWWAQKNWQLMFAGSDLHSKLKVFIPQGANKVYEVIAIGKSETLKKTIAAQIKHSAGILAKPITSGQNISVSNSKFQGEIPIKDLKDNKINPETREEIEEIPGFNFRTQDYKSKAQLEKYQYFSDQQALEKAYNIKTDKTGGKGKGKGKGKGNSNKGEELKLQPGRIIYVDDSLAVDYEKISSSNPDNPAVIVVNGTMNFAVYDSKVLDEIKNVYFIVKNDYNITNATPAHSHGHPLEINNSFVYAGGNITIDYPNFDYDGALMSQENINLVNANKGIGNLYKSEVEAEKINSDIFNNLVKENQFSLEPVVISWQEK